MHSEEFGDFYLLECYIGLLNDFRIVTLTEIIFNQFVETKNLYLIKQLIYQECHINPILHLQNLRLMFPVEIFAVSQAVFTF